MDARAAAAALLAQVGRGDEGIVLTIAASKSCCRGRRPRPRSSSRLALLAESFGRDVWWLWRQPAATPDTTAAVADAAHRSDGSPPCSRRSSPAVAGARAQPRREWVWAWRSRSSPRWLVWVALVAPYQPNDLTLNGFFRIPLEGLVLIALAAVLPRTPRRILAVSCGLVLTLVVVLKVINYEMFTLYDRPYDPLGDTSQLGNGIETLRSLVGGTETKLIEVGAVAGTVVLAVLLTLAMLRLTRVAADNRRWALRAVAGLGAVGALCFGVRRSAHLPHADRLHALRQSGRQRGQRGSGGHPRHGACSPPRSSTTRNATSPPTSC